MYKDSKKINQIKLFLKQKPFWIKFSHSLVYQRIRNPKFYHRQFEELNFYKELVKDLDNKLIFDIGANIGNKSYLFSKIAKQVLAFEPSKKCEFILKNRFEKSNVTIINIALGSNKNVIDYFEVDNDSAYSSLSKKHIETIVKGRNANNLYSITSKKVETDTIENYISKYGKPSYIKIDVEGYEIDVIKGLLQPVSIVSFESNLPEFRNETIESIDYLSNISNDVYLFNAYSEGPFLFENFISKDQITEFVKTTQLRSVEIFAKLKTT